MSEETRIPPQAIKGRGAVSRLAHRFASDERAPFSDGWEQAGEGEDGDAQASTPALRTQVIFEDAKSALSVNDSPDIYFEYSVNPYRGCEHGCIFIGGCFLAADGRRH